MKLSFAILMLPPLLSCANAQEWNVHQSYGNLEFFSEVELPLRRFVAELNSVQSEVHQLLGLPGSHQPVQIVIFRSMANYRAYLTTRVPEARNRRAIFYKSGSQAQIYAVYHNALVTDLRHEYTHALLHQTLPFIPLWIDEGMAEFLEEPPEKRSKSTRLSSVKWKSRTGWSPDLMRLEKLGTASGMTSEDYRDSWAWTHFLLNESQGTRVMLQDYLAVISAGGAPGMFSEWSKSRDPTVTKRVGSYFRRFRFSVTSRPRR